MNIFTILLLLMCGYAIAVAGLVPFLMWFIGSVVVLNVINFIIMIVRE